MEGNSSKTHNKGGYDMMVLQPALTLLEAITEVALKPF
jgi:hypothetical protein